MCITPTFQVNFSYLKSSRIYITRLCLTTAAVFEKSDAMVMYNTTDTQLHETRQKIFCVQTEYQI